MRRVVVTGLGLISPLGCGHQVNWHQLIAGETGIRKVEGFESDDLPSQIAGQIPRNGPNGLEIDQYLSIKDRRRLEPFIQYAAVASDLCLKDANFAIDDRNTRKRTGSMIGSGTGGLEGIEKAALTLHEKGPSRVSPFFVPSSIINQASSYVAIRHDLQGVNLTVVTACASGAHAIGEATKSIALGDADYMLAGGSEGSVCRLGISGFAALKALSTRYNDQPEKASRPWDKDRDGFVIGEGAALVFLETLESAQARKQPIYAEVIGYGLSSDAYHLTAPDPDGNGVMMAMEMAINQSGRSKEDIGYINAHATSTPMGDDIEIKVVESYFGSHAKSLAMSSTKGATGHLLGAAGALDAAYTILSLKHGRLPPTLNLVNPSYLSEIDRLEQSKSPGTSLTTAMSNAFGFGGSNASLIFASPTSI